MKGLHDDKWIRAIAHMHTPSQLYEFVNLWTLLARTNLDPDGMTSSLGNGLPAASTLRPPPMLLNSTDLTPSSCLRRSGRRMLSQNASSSPVSCFTVESSLLTCLPSVGGRTTRSASYVCVSLRLPCISAKTAPFPRLSGATFKLGRVRSQATTMQGTIQGVSDWWETMIEAAPKEFKRHRSGRPLYTIWNIWKEGTVALLMGSA